MPKVPKTNTPTQRRMRPGLTPEAREMQLESLAFDLAEKQLMEGTASSQVIVQFLKSGSRRERLERERLEKENELLRAKTEALEANKRLEEIYTKALNVLRVYSGNGVSEEDDEDL